jgi:hypothetical protein
MIRPYDAWVLSRILFGQALNGELEAVSRPFRRVADHLATRPVEALQNAWEGFLTGRDDRDQIILALANIDPTGPPPEADADDAARKALKEAAKGKKPEAMLQALARDVAQAAAPPEPILRRYTTSDPTYRPRAGRMVRPRAQAADGAASIPFSFSSPSRRRIISSHTTSM